MYNKISRLERSGHLSACFWKWTRAKCAFRMILLSAVQFCVCHIFHLTFNFTTPRSISLSPLAPVGWFVCTDLRWHIWWFVSNFPKLLTSFNIVLTEYSAFKLLKYHNHRQCQFHRDLEIFCLKVWHLMFEVTMNATLETFPVPGD